MPLESATYIGSLNSSNPQASDAMSQGDDHIRLIKAVLKSTFPNLTGAVTPTQDELNDVVAQAGTEGELLISGGTGVRNIILDNDAGGLEVTFTDTSHLNPTTVMTLDASGNLSVAGDFTADGDVGVGGGILIAGAMVSGTASVAGAASVGSLASAGAVTGTNITASGALNGATASVAGAANVGSLASAGAVSGTTGSFSGAVSGTNITASGALNGATASVAGAASVGSLSTAGAVTSAGVSSSDDIQATGSAFILPGSAGIKFADNSVMTTAAVDSYDPTITASSTALAALVPSSGADLVIKAGTDTLDGSGDNLSVTFPTAFPTACIAVFPVRRSASGANEFVSIKTKSASGFTAQGFDTGGGSAAAGGTVDWIAVGY